MKTEKRSLPRSIGAVFAGIVANVAIALALDALFHAMGVFPRLGEEMSEALFLLALSYRLLAAVAGGYLTALLAPRNPMKHALILGSIGVLMSTAGTVAMWDKGHHWYPLALVVISLPLSWLGAKLRVRS